MKISCQIIQLLFLLLFLSGCKTAGDSMRLFTPGREHGLPESGGAEASPIRR